MSLTRGKYAVIAVIVVCLRAGLSPPWAWGTCPECPCTYCWELQEGPCMEAELCQLRYETCYDWVIVCKESTNPPLVTAQEWADYVNVGYMVSDLDLRKDSWWEAECVPGAQCYSQESDWNLIADPWVRLHHWEFVGDPPDLTVPGSYTLKAVFTNDLIPDPIRCNPCWCPDGTEDCDECQRCPSTKVLNLDDPDVERLFTIWVVETEIIWPKQPITVEQGGALSESFLTDNGCYRQSNQAVVIGALGTNQPLARVEGKIDPSVLDPWWDIPSYLGDISHRDDEKPKDPGHIPPAVADHGGISFLGRYNKDPVCSDSVGITVYQDHLARDLANFHHLRRCSPSAPPQWLESQVPDCLCLPEGVSGGLQLIDNSCVPGISLTCGNSVSHAILGKGGMWGPNGLSGQTAYGVLDADTNEGVKTWQEFQDMWIVRGDIIQLGFYPAGSSPPQNMQSIHVCVATSSAPAWLVSTYAGDTHSKVFRRENPFWYYYMMWAYVWVPKEQYSSIVQGASNEDEWLNLYARVKVWRKTFPGGQ